jgi:hypothetical protein
MLLSPLVDCKALAQSPLNFLASRKRMLSS